MNVGEEMLTKNRVSMQSGEEEDAKEERKEDEAPRRGARRGTKTKRKETV